MVVNVPRLRHKKKAGKSNEELSQRWNAEFPRKKVPIYASAQRHLSKISQSRQINDRSGWTRSTNEFLVVSLVTRNWLVDDWPIMRSDRGL